MSLESFILPILAGVFSAGGVYFLIRQSRRDVDGLGGKLGRETRLAACRHHNTTMAILLLAKDDAQRSKVADMLKEPVD